MSYCGIKAIRLAKCTRAALKVSNSATHTRGLMARPKTTWDGKEKVVAVAAVFKM
jgi:hypothetical protein